MFHALEQTDWEGWRRDGRRSMDSQSSTLIFHFHDFSMRFFEHLRRKKVARNIRIPLGAISMRPYRQFLTFPGAVKGQDC